MPLPAAGPAESGLQHSYCRPPLRVARRALGRGGCAFRAGQRQLLRDPAPARGRVVGSGVRDEGLVAVVARRVAAESGPSVCRAAATRRVLHKSLCTTPLSARHSAVFADSRVVCA